MGTIKCLMTTGSNQNPEINDDWSGTIDLEAGKEYTREEMIELANCGDDDAIWVYEGEDWEDKDVVVSRLVNGAVIYKQKFYPWGTDNVKLVRLATLEGEKEDSFMEDWRREIAMEAGMMGGCEAYNEVMGY